MSSLITLPAAFINFCLVNGFLNGLFMNCMEARLWIIFQYLLFNENRTLGTFMKYVQINNKDTSVVSFL